MDSEKGGGLHSFRRVEDDRGQLRGGRERVVVGQNDISCWKGGLPPSNQNRCSPLMELLSDEKLTLPKAEKGGNLSFTEREKGACISVSGRKRGGSFPKERINRRAAQQGKGERREDKITIA